MFCINKYPLTLFFYRFIQPQKQNLWLATPRPGLLGRTAGTPIQLGQHEQQQGKTGLPHQVRGHIYSYEDLQYTNKQNVTLILKCAACANYWLFLKSLHHTEAVCLHSLFVWLFGAGFMCLYMQYLWFCVVCTTFASKSSVWTNI